MCLSSNNDWRFHLSFFGFINFMLFLGPHGALQERIGETDDHKVNCKRKRGAPSGDDEGEEGRGATATLRR